MFFDDFDTQFQCDEITLETISLESRGTWCAYFETPTQVKFRLEDDDDFIGGIAYHDYIICGECGSTIELSDEGLISVEPYEHWVSISDEIVG